MSTKKQGTEEETDFIRRPRRRWRRWAILSTVTALVAAGLTWFGLDLFTTCGPLGSGVSVVARECVGVTDGSYVFSPKLNDIEGRIRAENKKVASGRTVTIGLLDMYTANDTSPLTIDQEREELEGAYAAQLRANNTSDFRDPQPEIQLVLANEGSHEQAWRSVTHQLEGMTNDASPLIAVAGLGVSIQPTLDAAKDLAQHQIPMVGGVITSDVIANAGIPGFARVQPNDQQFVNSLTDYLDHNPALQSGLTVYDTNSGTKDKPGQDLYTWSLRRDIENVPLANSSGALGYVGGSVPGPVVPDLFSNTVSNICGAKPDVNVVFYAGRLIDLPSFLDALEHRECDAQPLTVATGGTDLGSLNDPSTIAKLNAAKLTVVYSSATDGPDWAAHPGSAPDHFAGFLSEFTGPAKEPVGDINDGYAIALHDAVATAVMATRLAYTAGSPTGGAALTPNSVLQQLNNLVNSDYVPGAAGDITFPDKNNGDPRRKPLPVLTIPPAAGAPVPSAACPPPDPNSMYCTP